MAAGTLEAAGVWFYCCTTARYLYLMRSDRRWSGTWGLPGGKVHAGESLLCAIDRECQEELGMVPSYQGLAPLEKFTSADENFHYHTFFAVVDHEFVPELNSEHLGYAWIAADHWPRPMHPGLWSMVNLDEINSKLSILRAAAHTSQREMKSR